MDITTYLREKRELVDSFLQSYFDSYPAHAVLNDAMSYSMFAGGKRIRPVLALASYEACGGSPEDIVSYASALEIIHTYSLIHDDLPAMDDDDIRRGKPTNHRVFGEGMAILAGDALLTEAFYLLSCTQQSPCAMMKGAFIPLGRSPIRLQAVMRVIREVAMASGVHGMVGGQAGDIQSEGDTVMDSDTLTFIHAHKTGALITVSVRMGGILANAGKKEIRGLTRYGENIGLAFQIIDDILDVQGNSAELGKPTGSDERKKKITYPGLYGIDLSRRKAEQLIDTAISALEVFPERADPLREIAAYLLQRKN
jgi:geranylgeranyl diphosphate synthase type II